MLEKIKIHSVRKLLLTTLVVAFILIIGSTAVMAEADRITVTDSDGYEVEIELPVETIVVTSSGINEILVALGAEDKIIGRDEWSEVSPVLEGQKDIPTVASSSFRLQIEAIAELEPDIVIADTMLQDEARKKLEIFDIPAIGERTSDAENIYDVIRRLALIVGEEERGEEVISYINDYRTLIKERVADVEEADRPEIFWEWRGEYQSGSSSSIVQPRIDLINGINIAADAEGDYPELSREYVIEKNPEIFIRVESRGTSREALQKSREKIKNRTGLDQVDAVQNERVYIITQAINTGLATIVGDFYFARAAHPEIFADIDPHEVNRELYQEFFEMEADETVGYPDSF